LNTPPPNPDPGVIANAGKSINEKKASPMDTSTTIQPAPEQIAACAHLIWEKEGRPHGRHESHWLQAERQLKLDCVHNAGEAKHPETTALMLAEQLQPARRNRPQRQAVIR